MHDIIKPAGWKSFDDLFTCEAGRAYVAEQLGGSVEPAVTFQSDRKGHDSASYDVFDDGSIWVHSNAPDFVHSDASDWANEELISFGGLYWEDCENRDGLLVDSMDKSLMVYLWGEDLAKDHFERNGGVIPNGGGETR